MNGDVTVVAFDSAGFIASVSHMDKQYASNTAKQLRRHYPSVWQMSYEEFCELQDKEMEERRKWNMV